MILHRVNGVTGNQRGQKFIISAYQRSERFNLHLYLTDHKLTLRFDAHSERTIFAKYYASLFVPPGFGTVCALAPSSNQNLLQGEYNLRNGNTFRIYRV